MKPCSQSCNVYSILMGYIWKSTEMAWLVPFIYPQQGHKEAQIHNSSQHQWQPCTTVPKDLVQVLPGTAHGCYLSTWGCFDTLSHKNSPSALKEERGHPLSHAVFNLLSVAAYAKKDNPPRMEAVPQARLPCYGQLQGSRSLASQTTGSCRQEESPSSFASKCWWVIYFAILLFFLKSIIQNCIILLKFLAPLQAFLPYVIGARNSSEGLYV